MQEKSRKGKRDGPESESDPVPDELKQHEASAERPFTAESGVLRMFGIQPSQTEKLEVNSCEDGIHVLIRLARKKCRCPVCGCMTDSVKGYGIRIIRHSVLVSTPCFIDYEQRRYECPNCGRTFNEDNPFAFPGERISAVTVINVLNDLRKPNVTFSYVGARYFISPTTVQRIFDAHVNIPRGRLPRYIVFDECYAFSSAAGDYVFVMMDFETLSVIDILPSRKKKDLEAYFSKIPLQERENVLMTSSDMWETYRVISRRFFPNAVHCVDSFHLKMELSRDVQQVRIRAQKKNENPPGLSARKISDPAEAERFETRHRNYYLLKKFHWMLYKRPDDDIFDPNREKVYNSVFKRYLNYYDIYSMLLAADGDLREAAALQECFYGLYRKQSAKAAAKALNELAEMFHSSDIKEMNSFGNTLTRWKKEIINSFTPVEDPEMKHLTIDDDLPPAEKRIIRKYIDSRKARKTRRMNSSLIENRNAMIQVIKKCANGYSNWSRFRNRVLFCLSKDSSFFLMPQPVSDDRINIKKSRKKKGD